MTFVANLINFSLLDLVDFWISPVEIEEGVIILQGN